MQQLILIIHVLAALSIIGLVLLQHGKGADIGASFGSGSSQTVFGSGGAVPFLMKVTVTLGAVFFCTSLFLTYIVNRQAHQRNLMSLPSSQQSQSINVNQLGQKQKKK